MACVFSAILLLASALAAPVSLQDPSGQHLIFLRLAINAAVVGPFGFVENEMVFQNPQPKRMEGRFSFALPVSDAGAAMPSRFAMEIVGKLMEGEVVNRSKAQKVYREILHEARDPALLEQSQGNIFTARVFPIEANAVVRLILSYAIPLPMKNRHRQLTIPLDGLPVIQDHSLQLSVQSLGGGFSANCSGATVTDGATPLRFGAAAATTAPTDVVLDVWEPLAATRSFSVGQGQLVTSFVLDEPVADTSFTPSSWAIYIDTSASTADSFLVRPALLEAFLDAMPAVELTVYAFDVEVVEIWSKKMKDATLGSSVRSSVEQRLPLGSTDLEKLLGHVDSQAAHGVLVVSDCIASTAERAAKRLGLLLSPQEGKVVQVLAVGTKFDSVTGGAIAAAGGGRVVRMPLTSKELAAASATAWAAIQKPLGLRGEPKQVDGWVWPEAAYDLQDGDELLVFSASEGLTASPPTLQIGNRSLEASLEVAGAAFSSLLSREVSRARLELLEAERQLANSSHAREILYELVSLSEQSRVMTPHTALLVLETDEDYVRFGISQDRLSPILTVTSSGVELVNRQALELPALPEPVDVSGFVANETTNVSCDDAECVVQELSQDEDLALEAVNGASESDFQQAGGAGRLAPAVWLLMLCLCSANSWGDLDQVADETLKKHPTAPTARLRDTAQDYCGALWAKRRATELKSYVASWITWDPANGLAYEYLTKAAQHENDDTLALRAATSIAEVAPRDSEQLLRGSWLLLSLNEPVRGRDLALRSLEEREDNVNTYRALALAYQRSGAFAEAAATYARALQQSFHPRYGDVKRVLREEAAMMMRGLRESSPSVFDSVSKGDLKDVDVKEGEGISLWISMSWLTDANDVDLHVIDPRGEECYYGHKFTKVGLELYSDQTQGLGPEVIALGAPTSGKYRVGVKYYSSGAMGASRGTLLIRKMVNGVPVGDPIIEVFTLPAKYSQVLPVAEVTL